MVGEGIEDRILGNFNMYKIYNGDWDGVVIMGR